MKIRYVVVAAALVALAVFGVAGALGGTGNGAPSGPHYNLNLIGFANGQSYSQQNSGGNVIHVPLSGNCKIDLAEGPFGVLDDNCSDGSDAAFQLPNPDPTNSGTTSYSVFARALGKPGGKASMDTCGFDPSTGETVCSVEVLDLKRDTGKSTFQNVSKYLLYIYYTDSSGKQVRVPLFDSSLQDYFWSYDNTGLRLAQLRFYPGVCTMVPSATNPDGTQQIVTCTS
jgi:hypothetical protein